MSAIRRIAGCAAALTVAVLTIVGPIAGPASAHAQLLSTDPTSGTRVETAPTEIRLNFSESVTLPKNAVQLTDRDRQPVKVGDVRLDGTSVVAPLPALANGGYVVTYRVVSSDSHPITGTFTFAVGSTANVPDAAEFGTERASRAVGVLLGVMRAFQYGALLGVVGLVMVFAWFYPDALANATVRRTIAWLTAVIVVTALVGIALQGANGRAGSLGDALDPDVWGEALDTNFGKAWIARAVLAFVWCAVALAHAHPKLPRKVWQVAADLCAVGLGTTVIMSGHAESGRWRAVAIGADAVHLLGAAFWFGGLVAIALTFTKSAEIATAIARRFSPIALVSVAAIAVSGFAQGLRQSGTGFSDFTDSSYGRLLLVKVLLVTAVVIVASMSRRVVNARRGDSEDTAGRTPSLRNLVGIEVAGLVAVIAVTAGLVDAVPPLARFDTGPIELTRPVAGQTLDVVVEPTRAGPVELHLTMLQPGTAVSPINSPVQEMKASFEADSGDLGPLAVKLVKAGPAHYISEGFVIPFAGSWTLTVTVRTSDFDQTDEKFTIEFR
ncbi:MAG: copper resistance CopC/CopD family protein [Acidimicrobiia bacterium]